MGAHIEETGEEGKAGRDRQDETPWPHSVGASLTNLAKLSSLPARFFEQRHGNWTMPPAARQIRTYSV